jgi:hypothetical protein
MTEDHIDRAQQFLDSLQRLGSQLRAAEEQQKHYLARMIELKEDDQADTDEYRDLNAKSQSLQAIIDKYRPIYMERMEMVREVKMQRRKRSR